MAYAVDSLWAHQARLQPLAGRFAKYTFGDAGQLPPVLTDHRGPVPRG